MPGSAGGYPPAPPQTRTCPIKAYGSSEHGFAAYWNANSTCQRAPANFRGSSLNRFRYLLQYRGHMFGLCVPFVLPRNSSIPRRLPSLLTGSDRLVRLFSIGTMKPLRLPLVVSRHSVYGVAPRYLGLISCFARRGEEIAATPPGCCSTGLTLCSGACPKDTFGSHKFPAIPSCIRPALRPRPSLHARLLAAFRCCPHAAKSRGPQRHHFLSWLNYTAFALAVYASCRPLGRRRKTRFGWFAKPSPMGFFIPIEFVRRVSTIASPLPGLLVAICPLIFLPIWGEQAL